MKRMARQSETAYEDTPVEGAPVGGALGIWAGTVSPRAQAALARVGPDSTVLQQMQPKTQALMPSSIASTKRADNITDATDRRAQEVEKRIKRADASAERYRKGGMVGCRDYGK